MRTWLSATLDTVRTSLWLVPASMAVLGVVLAVVMLEADAGLGAEDHVRVWWINTGSGEDARNLLSTLLSAIITMASMAFSVTVVALSLAANAYGSRLVRVFRADRRTQLVLGTFVMTIFYCLIVLRSTHAAAPMPEVPHLSVTVGTLLSLMAVLALLSFIQGVARSITADEVVRRVRRELEVSVLALPELSADEAEGGHEHELPSDWVGAAHIPLPREGYVQAVDYEGMTGWAAQNGAVLRLDFQPGDFVVGGDRRVMIFPPPADAARARREIDRFIISGDERTPTQDLEFSIRHLVEVALRALSPGINDPFTAKAVIDRLRGALSRLTQRALPSPFLGDRAGHVRVIRPAADFGRVFDAAFHQIRQAATDKPAVLIHMLEAIAAIAGHARGEHQLRALERHAELIRNAAERNVAEPSDLEDVQMKCQQAISAIGISRAQLVRPKR